MRQMIRTAAILMNEQGTSIVVRRMALSGICASLIGIGLSRFAFTPLLPELIAEHWFPASSAAYLGAANLAGYLAGAILARPVTARIAPVSILRSMMIVATGAFFACAFPLSFSWFFLWRFLSGLSGGVIMVLVAPTIMPHVPPSRRGLVAGAIFVGVGIGIIASGTLVPAMLPWGLVRTWQGLGSLALILSIIAWNGWPEDSAKTVPSSAGGRRRKGKYRNPVLTALYFEYALDAAGIVTHVIFFVDFITRGLERGLRVGAEYWVIFGLAAAIGPLITGHLADRIGFRLALRLGFLMQFAAVGILVVTTNAVALTVSSVVVGAFVPGIVPLVFGRMQELTAGNMHRQKATWGFCATAFALGQTCAAYGLSYIFARTGGAYIPLFAVSAGALLLAFIIDIVANALSARRGDIRAEPVPGKAP